MREPSRSIWDIGLSAWIIQDGNYPDFVVGDTVEFAVEFYHPPGAAVQVCRSDAGAIPVNENKYAVVAETLLAREDVTVLDIGIEVFHDGATQFPQTGNGNRFRTELELSIDPYFYFERLSHDGSVPPLIYTWEIRSILRQTGPFIEAAADSGPYAGKPTLSRDLSKLSFEKIAKTDAWEDDARFGEYILRCNLLPVPAKRTSTTAT